MGNSVRLYALLIILSALIVVIAVLGGSGGVFQKGDPLPPKLSVNLIAYVDSSGQIKTVNPNGSSETRISPDLGFFTWPMWSPDAGQIAFSGTSRTESGSGPLELYVYDLDEDKPSVIYTNDPRMGPILSGMPHYPIWAPDSSRLAFMASEPQGLTLLLDDPKDDVAPDVLVRNSPLYASWSGDSIHLLVHSGFDHLLVDVGGEVRVTDLGIRAARYRAPAWWPSGNRMAFVSEDDAGKSRLFVSDVDAGRRTLMAEVPGEAAFLWSPDGDSLAVAPSDFPGGILYRGVALFSPDGNRQPLDIDEDVIAFFWSPDSTMLAYVTPTETRGVVSWNVFDVADGSRWRLVDFIPSPGQVTLFRFFDQFAHSPWSPDSDSLVFSGNLGPRDSSASLSRQQVFHIIVVDAGPDPSPELIAEGVLAVWSPR